MYVMYVYKTTSRFTSACKYNLIKLLTFIFARRYLSSQKQPPLTLSYNSESLETLNQSKKNDVTLIFSIIAKENSDQIRKNRKIRKNFFGFLRL